MNNQDLEELKRLCEQATPGPWASDKTGVWTLHPKGLCGPVLDAHDPSHPPHDGIGRVGDPYPRGINSPTESMAFIAAARTALPKLIEEVEQCRATLDDVRDLLSQAAHGDDGVDDSDVAPAITLIGELLGDDDDYRARQKCSDDPCELCGEGGIRQVLRKAYAAYVGVCDDCYNEHVAEEKRNVMPRGGQ